MYISTLIELRDSVNEWMALWIYDSKIKILPYLSQKVENLRIPAVMREFLKIAKEFIKNFLRTFSSEGYVVNSDELPPPTA